MFKKASFLLVQWDSQTVPIIHTNKISFNLLTNPTTKFHPDRNPGILAKKKFQEIHAAYEILMDPQKRETYDLMGMEGLEDRVCGAQGGKVKITRLESAKQTESFLFYTKYTLVKNSNLRDILDLV